MLESVRSVQGATYSVRGAELAQSGKTNSRRTTNLTVVLLDETQKCFTVEKKCKGSVLLEKVYTHLELTEKEYFGLQFIDQKEIVRWVDHHKSIKKQLFEHTDRASTPPVLYFKVKFYVTDPSQLLDEFTRYQLYLQVRKDILSQKLPVSHNMACLLASYTVQAELGDYNPSEHQTGYLSTFHLLTNQTTEDERKICELHKLHRGQLPMEAELNYLEHAKRLDLYGVELHKAVDSSGKDIVLGVTAIGLVVIQNNIRVNTFSWSKIMKVSFKRKNFFLQLRREVSESYDTLLGFTLPCYRRSKILWKSCVEHHTFFRLHTPQHRGRLNFGFGLSLRFGSKYNYSGCTHQKPALESKPSRVFVRSPSRRIIAEKPGHILDLTTAPPLSVKSPRSHDNKVTATTKAQQPRKAWENYSDDEGGFVPKTLVPIGYVDEDVDSKINSDSAVYDTPPYSDTHSPIPQSDEGTVSIHLTADDQGRFGFNVKGGSDLGLPILVSRVAPNTPAYRCTPKLNEGDQVIKINGRDVSKIPHEEVVSLIRSSRESKTGELVLTVKPNILVNVYEEEPLYQYVPDRMATDMDSSNLTLPCDNLYDPDFNVSPLCQSMMLLCDGLASGALISQYEQLYRKNPDLSMAEAKKVQNVSKNRYRDIAPYDCTRVILNNYEGGNYINANYVNMEISGTGIINRYIATQGPLSNTVADFWHMVLQSESRLIVMLTTVTERGRVKCHQYWPTKGDTLNVSANLTVLCEKEKADNTGSFVFRELLLINNKTGIRRVIQHLQYLAWPDHGVPSDPNMFLCFTERVRLARSLHTDIADDLPLRPRSMISTPFGSKVNSPAKSNKSISSNKSTISNGSVSKTEASKTLFSPKRASAPPTMTDCPQIDQVIPAPIANLSEISLGDTTEVSSDESLKQSDLEKIMSGEDQNPIIVHCSAGIGRTGVLILMDTALCLMQNDEPIYPLDIVQAMRDQRAMMIQNASQYHFVCESIYTAYRQRVASITK
ncbi:LOW QUALITY PROTEIN: tyrosine-protein phosphatase non-receptor type 4-like [Ctenocephalides felis]|uniref:LOW QUALITY PROTEIN: tyrosine-protein phosphatase non-receptor type 4-like n=1 Tax=Ctenocephalides felis TaxID=7515 RepID=UPI000E6E4806|nr:LOW QUALITY PROTEIN: tyrosine-protein phosphatase non-receptor type 4-like [Ctenocephalides felis]